MNSNNAFKKLEDNVRSVPPDMRQKVMKDVAMAKLLMDFTFFVTENYPAALKRLFRTLDNNEN